MKMTREEKLLNLLCEIAGIDIEIKKEEHLTRYPQDRSGNQKTGYKVFNVRLLWKDGSLVYARHEDEDKSNMTLFEISVFEYDDVFRVILDKLNGIKLYKFAFPIKNKIGHFHPFDREKYFLQFKQRFVIPKFKTLSELELRLNIM